MRLTELTVRNLAPPQKGQKTYHDDALKGFGVRVSQGGTKTFVLVHGPMRERTTIGRYPLIGLSDARTEAKRILAERTLGKHRPSPTTFEEARTRFLEHSTQKNRKKTVDNYKSLLRHFPFGRTRLADISRHDIAKRIERIDKPAERDHALVAIKIVFKWALRQGLLETDPTAALPPQRPKTPRSRVLSADELRRVWSYEDEPFSSIVKLLLLLGQRRTETSLIEESWIDGDLIHFPAALTKNKRDHTIPFGALAASFLPPQPFAGWGRAKSRMDRIAQIPSWTLHDLRRTFSTIHAEIGTPIHVTEKLLNHVSGTISGVAATYNRHTYLAEMRVAVANYEAHIQRLVGGHDE